MVIIEGTKKRATSPCPVSPEIYNTSDPCKQFHQLITASFNNYAVANNCCDIQLSKKVIHICDIDLIAATYIVPVSFNTPFNLVYYILECPIHCYLKSVFRTDVDGYMPLHYIIPHSHLRYYISN